MSTDREFFLEQAVRTLASTLRSAALCLQDDRAELYIGIANTIESEMFPPFVNPDLITQPAKGMLQIVELKAERDSARRRSEHFQRTAYSLETTLQACAQRLNCETGPAVVLELDKLLKSRCERAEAVDESCRSTDEAYNDLQALSTPATPDTEVTDAMR